MSDANQVTAPLSDEELAELRRMEESIGFDLGQPRERWELIRSAEGFDIVEARSRQQVTMDSGMRGRDAQFIVAARNALPRLLDEIARLRAENARQVEALRDLYRMSQDPYRSHDTGLVVDANRVEEITGDALDFVYCAKHYRADDLRPLNPGDEAVSKSSLCPNCKHDMDCHVSFATGRSIRCSHDGKRGRCP